MPATRWPSSSRTGDYAAAHTASRSGGDGALPPRGVAGVACAARDGASPWAAGAAAARGDARGGARLPARARARVARGPVERRPPLRPRPCAARRARRAARAVTGRGADDRRDRAPAPRRGRGAGCRGCAKRWRSWAAGPRLLGTRRAARQQPRCAPLRCRLRRCARSPAATALAPRGGRDPRARRARHQVARPRRRAARGRRVRHASLHARRRRRAARAGAARRCPAARASATGSSRRASAARATWRSRISARPDGPRLARRRPHAPGRPRRLEVAPGPLHRPEGPARAAPHAAGVRVRRRDRLGGREWRWTSASRRRGRGGCGRAERAVCRSARPSRGRYWVPNTRSPASPRPGRM